jgi:hypothetical protein
MECELMRRRDFVKSLLATSSALASQPDFLRGFPAAPDAPDVKRVLVMFKCHLDVGFADTQAAIIRKYFAEYFPRAMQVGTAMRQSGTDRYVWTTGSWLLYEYLEQASTEQRRLAEQAVAAGDLAWHALPFTWQTEFMDRSMIEGALGFSQSLDQRFGRTTTGAKMTDVPGHSRGLVGPLAAHGVKFLHIGVNGASTPPEVPTLFVWQDPEGTSLIMMYHRDYGGIAQPPDSDLAVDVEMLGDNQGPHSVEQITKVYARLRKQFPQAQVTAANLSEIAAAVEPYRNRLPVVTQEIGDTWIYGVPSDPIKVARYREVARLRKQWVAQNKFRAGDAVDRALLSRLALCPEHTWGLDNKRLQDYQHYTPKDLMALDLPKFRETESSWAEKRKIIDDGIATLPEPLRSAARDRLRALQPVEPARAGLRPHPHGAEMETAHWVMALDPQTGAIQKLRARSTGREWASAAHPLALFSYQTLSKADYDRYDADYVTVKEWWAVADFGKPKIEDFGAQSRVWTPALGDCWSGKVDGGHRLLAQLRIDDAEAEKSGRVAWPGKMFLDVFLPEAEPVVRISFSCFDKVANRLPEALWLSFLPQAPEPQGWMLDKVDRWVSPFDVVRGGNRQMHAVTREVRYKDAQGSLSIETLDAPVVALGEKSPIAFSTAQPDIAKGLHFSLFNNAWGTNYIEWFGEDTRFRFVLRA